nr:hypothetical protein [Streptomyces rubrolavendulae]
MSNLMASVYKKSQLAIESLIVCVQKVSESRLEVSPESPRQGEDIVR